jgi:hypothetical protein
MKTVMIFLLATTIAFSQTREPSQHTFYMGSNPFILDTQNGYFKLDKFQLGWHWGSMKKITNALGFNVVHYNIDDMMRARPYYRDSVELDTLADSVHIIMNSSIVGNNWSKYSPAYSISYQYEPTLFIDPNPLDFNPRAYDTTKPIFGFTYIRGHRIPTKTSDANFNR